ncbi:MAG: peptidylprolyl isomerase [Clostridia bacterium]|nr:peptidylprolyl isomerase [Clostridia bacterium]
MVRLYDDLSKDELIEMVIARQINDLTRTQVEGMVKYKLIELLENDDLQNEDEWTPDTIRYPGMFGSDDAKSLEREAMRRFLTTLRESVTENFRLSASEKATYIRELNELDTTANTNGISFTYPELGKTELMKMFVGEDLEKDLKIALLQSHINASTEVTDDEVLEHYNTLLASQQSKYSIVDSFYTDVKSGSVSPLLYYPNGNYYYVKHILVPFSDAQTSALSSYKAQFESVVGESGIAQYKNQLGASVTGYAHVNGENSGSELTIQQIYADIENQIAKVANDPVAREKKFDELIYKYNTDDGIFGNELGYAVKGNFDDVSSDSEKYDATYMKEFAVAADELYRAGVEGALSGIVTTDYGVHILYLSKIIPTTGKTLGLNDYVSNLNETKVYDLILQSKLTEKRNAEFSKWLSNKIGGYDAVEGKIVRNESAYADLKKVK